MHKSVNKYSRKVKETYNQNISSKGLKIPAGVYRGIVVEHGDDRQMGRIKVNISQFYGSVATKEVNELESQEFLGAIWCRLVVPYGGTYSDEGSAQSYGFLGAPPAVGNEVLVAFSGDSDKGFILGVLPEEQRISTMAGPVARMAIDENGDRVFTQAYDTDRTRSTENDLPAMHGQAAALVKQGLAGDRLRGLNFSNPTRSGNTVNRVTAISTPEGHSIIMDDGDIEGNNFSLMRFRTAAGAQILMDDNNGFTYIISRDGKTWIEMNSNGDLDIFSEKSINMNTSGDFNVRAGGAINMESANGFNLRDVSPGGIKMFASVGTIDIKAATDLQLQAGGNGNLLVAGGWRETAARIDMNGPVAKSATEPSITKHPGNRTVTESVSRRVPEKEPWPGHLNVSNVSYGSVTGSEGVSLSFYEGAPSNPNAVENTGTLTEAANITDDAVLSGSGLVVWAPGVDRRVDQRLIDIVERIAKRFGKTLTITSGYRSPGHNASLRDASGRQLTAKNSQHMYHRAVDLSGNEFTNAERLRIIEIASSEGITGIGVYNDKHIHLDIRGGNPIGWGSGNTFSGIPDYAVSTIQKHISGGFA